MTLSNRIFLHGGSPPSLGDYQTAISAISKLALVEKEKDNKIIKIRFILYLIVLEGILSSSTNFLIYCFIGHNFRKEFLLLLGLRRKMVRNFSRAILIKSFFTKGAKLLGMFSVLLYDVRFYQFPVRVPSLQKTIADCSGCERASLAITVGHHGHCHHHYHHHHHHPRTVFIDIQ